MRLLHSGIDALYLAVRCTLPIRLVDALTAAKERAAAHRSEEPIALDKCDVRLFVADHGANGGYAFVGNTGVVGEMILFRNDPVHCRWNVFVKPRASTLLALGFGGAIRQALSTLKALGVEIVDHSVNRVDYAFDILTPGFTLSLNEFVAHPRSKRRPYWNGEVEIAPGPRAVFQSSNLQSVTIGTMPGAQVCVYDKTAEVRGADKRMWVEAWGLESALSSTVWRVELRAGKNALRARDIHDLEQLERRLRDLLLSILSSTRYVDSTHLDSNVSRRRLHPIWQLVSDHAKSGDLISSVGKVAPSRVAALDREQKLQQHESMIVGNAAGIAALRGMNDTAIRNSLPKLIGSMIEHGARHPDGVVMKSVTRARRRHPPVSNDSK